MGGVICMEGHMLIQAVKDWNLVEIRHSLMPKDVDVNAKDADGNTVLHIVPRFVNVACREDYVLVPATRKEDCASGSATRKEDYASIPTACKEGEILSFVKHVVGKGADVSIKNNGGQTPLHIAAYFDCSAVASLFIKLHADINAQDNDGKTPLHIATEVESEEVEELLMDHGARTDIKDKNGKLPLDEDSKFLHDICRDENKKSLNESKVVSGGKGIDSKEDYVPLAYGMTLQNPDAIEIGFNGLWVDMHQDL